VYRRPLSMKALQIFAQTLFLQTRIIDLHSAAYIIGLSSFNFFLLSSVKGFFSARVRFGRSRSSKVIDSGTNRKRVLRLPISPSYSNLGPILCHLRDIACLSAICVNAQRVQMFYVRCTRSWRRCWTSTRWLSTYVST